MYRYTFPELVMTNRECGEDEVDYKAMAGYSFLLGLRFDMTIFRCWRPTAGPWKIMISSA